MHGKASFLTGYVHEALHVLDSVIAQEPHHVLALNNKGRDLAWSWNVC